MELHHSTKSKLINLFLDKSLIKKICLVIDVEQFLKNKIYLTGRFFYLKTARLFGRFLFYSYLMPYSLESPLNIH